MRHGEAQVGQVLNSNIEEFMIFKQLMTQFIVQEPHENSLFDNIPGYRTH